MKGNRELLGGIEIFRLEFSLLHANCDGSKKTADGSANANAYDKGNQRLLLSHYCKSMFFLSASLSFLECNCFAVDFKSRGICNPLIFQLLIFLEKIETLRQVQKCQELSKERSRVTKDSEGGLRGREDGE
jgi:hypothetical protein